MFSTKNYVIMVQLEKEWKAVYHRINYLLQARKDKLFEC